MEFENYRFILSKYSLFMNVKWKYNMIIYVNIPSQHVSIPFAGFVHFIVVYSSCFRSLRILGVLSWCLNIFINIYMDILKHFLCMMLFPVYSIKHSSHINLSLVARLALYISYFSFSFFGWLNHCFDAKLLV